MRRLSLVFVFCLALQLVAAGVVLAGDATSFNPVPIPVASKGAGGVPVGTIVAWPVAKNPEDMDNWLECNGQTVSATVYPELFATVGGRVPDFRGLFLRGADSGGTVGQRKEDSVRAHAHRIEQHSHTVGGTASAQSYQGVDSSGSNGAVDLYFYYTSMTGDVPSEWRPVDIRHGNTFSTGNVIHKQSYTGGGIITGYTDLSGPTSTYDYGSIETAPVHIKVKYFIRAKS